MELGQESLVLRNNNSELNELEVISSFIHNFESTYGTHHVAFAQKPFRQVISENIFSPAETWRVIALYLHHGTDLFAQNWCKELASEETITILEECFCVLPWDVSDYSYHETLKMTLAKNLKDSFDFFNQKSGVIFILQLNGIPSVVTTLQGNISTINILHTLRELKELLRNESAKFQQECEMHKESQPIIGSNEFQQNMLEMLGDRDYDCFEHNQMKELKKKIGFALFGFPKEDTYTKKELEQINSIFNCIIKQNIYAKYKNQIIISFIFNCTEPLPGKRKEKEKNPDYNLDADITAVPIFVLKKCYSSDHGCRIFIDHECRVYTSWSEYIKDNRLYKCMMVLPKNGCYKSDENGIVLLEQHCSPACKLGHKLAKIGDISASGVGVVSGGALVAASIPAITVAPVIVVGAVTAVVASGAFSVIRNIATLKDMTKHKQDTNLIRSKEARSATLGIAAATFGVLGTGATALLSQAVSRGVNIGRVVPGTVNLLNATNLAIGAVGLGNSIIHVLLIWKDGDKISTLTYLQLGISTLFFANSVYSFKTAATIVDETQTSVLNQMKNELKYNQRKMVNKMHKETIRMNGGDKRAGTADVISTIRNIPNKNEIFKILKANNKLLNKNGVKFSASGTEILFNGKPLDLESFAILSKPEKLQVLSDMPATPTPQQANVTFSSNNIINSLTKEDFVKLVSFGNRLYTDSTSLNHAIQITLQEFSQIIKEKLLKIAMSVINETISTGFRNINNVFPPCSEPIIAIINIVKIFVWNMAEKYKREYEESKRRAQERPDFDADKFDEMYGIRPNTIDKNSYFCEVVIDIIIYGNKVVQKYYLDQFVNYLINLIIAKLVNDNQDETKEKEQKQHYEKRIKKSCDDCKGHYFVD